MTSLHLAILHGASLLVPATERAEWLAEWRAELWYIKRAPTVFCLGAFRDALWLRRNTPSPNVRRTFGLESPLRCVLLLAALTAASVFFAFRLPLPREILLPSPYRDARDLVMISAAGRFNPRIPTVSLEQYRAILNGTQHRFAGLAFYRPIQARVQTAELSVAVASANLFRLLDLPISAAAPNSLVLSHTAWKNRFGGDPHIVGRLLENGGHTTLVAGVLPADAWQLPGRIDAWLLEDDLQLPPHTLGFVLGHVTSAPSQTYSELSWRLSVPTGPDHYDRFECSSLAKERFLALYLLIFVISLLVLSAITPLALGEYPANRYSPTGALRLRRWIFLGLKIALLFPLVFCGSLDLASFLAPGLQPHGFLIGLIAALRWALIDQRRRCPVCLRLLTNPTRIGRPSQIFLEWYGTELICSHGHGLLYVPEIRTSCYSTQRWQYLDPSWSSLFS